MDWKLLHKLKNEKRAVRKALEDAIFDAFEKECIRKNLDFAYWGPYGTEYLIDDKPVSCKSLDKLETLYLKEIHFGGIVVVWRKGRGFV